MANLTLSIDEDLLRHASEVATRERTTVDDVVREFLARYVDARTQRLQALDTLDALAERSLSRSDSPPWSRESLHQR